MTLHRAENVDHKDRLQSILEGIKLVRENFPEYEIVFPIHPRTKNRIINFGLEVYLKDSIVIDPVRYLDFLMLEANARLILTDSGGIQEEACILRIPCVTLRTETERPETVEVGANIVAGRNPENILKSVEMMLQRERNWKNPFGNGKASKSIIDILENYVG
jgi:UDP-N-acetylglucosamine 2-epimerase (non-hydrolysing)